MQGIKHRKKRNDFYELFIFFSKYQFDCLFYISRETFHRDLSINAIPFLPGGVFAHLNNLNKL